MNVENYLQILMDPGLSVFPFIFSEGLYPHTQVFILSPQCLCPGLGWELVGNSSDLNFLCLSSLPCLVLSLVVQVVFVPGDKVPAAWAGPVPQWWTVGAAAELKWSPSPSVCTHTPHMLSYDEIKFKSESEPLQSHSTHSEIPLFYNMYVQTKLSVMTFALVGFEIILDVSLFPQYV